MLPPPLLRVDLWQERLLLLHGDVCVQLLFVFKLESLLEVINQLLAIDTTFPWWQLCELPLPLLLDLSLYLIGRLPSRYEIYRMILLSCLSDGFRVLDDGLLRTLLLLLWGTHALAAGLGLDRRVINLGLLWRRVEREEHLANVGLPPELLPQLRVSC